MATKLTTRETSRPLPTLTVTDTEVIALIASESNPSRRPYEVVLNRYTGKARCNCRGFGSHRHCKHSEAMTKLALIEGWIISIRRGRRAEPKAVVEPFDPFISIPYLADDYEMTPTEIAYADRIASEAEVAAYTRENQARWIEGGC